MPPQKLKGKDYSWDVILQSNKKQVNNQVRANTYDFWLSGQYGKFNSNIFLFHPLSPFPPKNNALPLNSLFWSPLTAVHRFDAWDMAVPGLYISWFKPSNIQNRELLKCTAVFIISPHNMRIWLFTFLPELLYNFFKHLLQIYFLI